MRISDWSSDVCSSDLLGSDGLTETPEFQAAKAKGQHMPIVYSEIARKTPAKTTAEWLALFAENDIPAMAVRDLQDRKSVVSGKRVSVRVDLGGRRHIKKEKI